MEHQTLGWWVVCPSDPASQCIILKIVGFYYCHIMFAFFVMLLKLFINSTRKLKSLNNPTGPHLRFFSIKIDQRRTLLEEFWLKQKGGTSWLMNEWLAYVPICLFCLLQWCIIVHCTKPSQTQWVKSSKFSLIFDSVSVQGWFSVGICKYKPGYKSHDLL